MDKDAVFKEILRLVFSLPQKDQLKTLTAAWVTVSQDDLARAWNDGEFKHVQARQLRLIEKIHQLVKEEPDLELLRWRAEFEKATEEGDSVEMKRLEKELWRRVKSLPSR